jgi:hypothetical protein
LDCEAGGGKAGKVGWEAKKGKLVCACLFLGGPHKTKAPYAPFCKNHMTLTYIKMLCIKDSVQGKEKKATLFLKNDCGD